MGHCRGIAIDSPFGRTLSFSLYPPTCSLPHCTAPIPIPSLFHHISSNHTLPYNQTNHFKGTNTNKHSKFTIFRENPNAPWFPRKTAIGSSTTP